MVSMETELRTVGRHFTLGAHEEVFVAAIAELVFALGTSEVHTAAPGQIVSEFAFRTIYAIQLQMLRHTLGLNVRIVRFLPLGELLARQFLVLLFPLSTRERVLRLNKVF